MTGLDVLIAVVATVAMIIFWSASMFLGWYLSRKYMGGCKNGKD